MLSNQAQFDETVFPFRNKEMIEKYQSDKSIEILFRTESDVKWIPYNLLHISNYTRVHWVALHHMMEYLEGFPSFKLTYRRRTGIDDGLSCYADSDWDNSSSRRSTSGNLCLYNRSPIVWHSKLQKTTALSTAEAEYYSASAADTEVLYLRNLLESMVFA
jgi:hypothetical protein